MSIFRYKSISFFYIEDYFAILL